MGEDLPAVGSDLLGVDRDDDALLSELPGQRVDQGGIGDGGRVDRDLVGPRQQQRARVGDRAHSTPHRQRHEADVGRPPHDLEDRVAPLVARTDVEEDQFVGACRVVRPRRLDGVARVRQIDEVDALDDAPGVDVEARDDADGEHRQPAARTPVLTPIDWR